MDRVLGRNISDVKMNPKIAWDNIKTLRNGFDGHYVKKNSSKFRNRDGSMIVMEKENAWIVGEHLNKVFNRDARVDWEHGEDTPQKKLLNTLEIH